MKKIQDIRKEYTQQTLSEATLGKDPIAVFQSWLAEAIDFPCMEPTAMTLSTVDSRGVPSGRIVLLKEIDSQGSFCFFTNYNSRKGKELAVNQYASLTFFWAELERQVRILGKVAKGSDGLSEAYFKSRPVGSQLAAIVSPQSDVIESRQWLDSNYETAQKNQTKLLKPQHWGAYLLSAQEIEFWQGGKNRLHDRILYSKGEAGWEIVRLAP